MTRHLKKNWRPRGLILPCRKTLTTYLGNIPRTPSGPNICIQLPMATNNRLIKTFRITKNSASSEYATDTTSGQFGITSICCRWPEVFPVPTAGRADEATARFDCDLRSFAARRDADVRT